MGGSTKRTTDLQMPVKTNGTRDNRYAHPQFVRSDGKRDKRTTPSYKRT